MLSRFRTRGGSLTTTVVATVFVALIATACSSTDPGPAIEAAVDPTATAVTLPAPDPTADEAEPTAVPVEETVEPTAVPEEPAPVAIETIPVPDVDPGIELVVGDDNVLTGELDNGLRYFIRENDSPGFKAEFRLVVDAGSVLESDQQLGGAHFLEHMMFNGTEDYPGNEVVAVLEDFGSSFGPDLNAYTSFDETVYILSVPSTDERIGQALNILEQWAGHALLDPIEVEDERGVVLEEWRLGLEGLGGRLNQIFLDETLRGSDYEGREPIGSEESILAMETEELRRFYDDWYQPQRMSVIAVGDFDADNIETAIIEEFSDLAARAEPRDVDIDPFEVLAEPRAAQLLDAEMPVGYLEVSWPGPAFGDDDPQAIAETLRRSVAFSIIETRLRDAVARGEIPAGEWSVGDNTFTVAGSAPYLGVQSTATVQAELLEALLAEVETARRFGFTATEVDEYVGVFRSNFEQGLNQLETRQDAEYAADLVEVALGREPLAEIESWTQLSLDLLDDVTADAVTAQWQDLIATREPLVVVLGNDGEAADLVEPGEALAMVDAARSADLVEQTETADVPDELMALPEPAEVTDRGVIDEIREFEVVQLRLENGADVILVDSPVAEGSVSFSAVSPGGLAVIPTEDVGRMRLMDDIVNSSGVGPHDLPTLEAILRADQVSLSAALFDSFEELIGESSTDDLDDMLALANLLMTAPRADEVALARMDSQIRAVLEDSSSLPNFAISEAIAERWFGDDPRFQPLPEVADLDGIDLDTDLAMWADRFDDPQDFRFILIGDLDIDETEDLVRRYIGSIPSSGAPADVVDPALHPTLPAEVQEVVVASGSGNQGSLSLVFSQPEDFSEKKRFGLALLEEATGILIRDELRERLSASYSPSALASFSGFDQDFVTMNINVNGDPDRLDEIEAAVLEIVGSLATDGVPEETFDTAFEVLNQRYAFYNNEYFVAELARASLLSTDPVDSIRRSDINFALRRADIDNLAATVFDLDEYISVRQIPEE